MSLEFLLTSLVVVLLPGTGVLYTLASSLAGGFRAGFFAAFGCTLGIIPHIAMSIAGLAALLHASALAFQTVQYLGVLYLFYMAWGILRSGGTLDVSAKAAPASPLRIVASGFIVNILNPKLSLFFLAFLPQFVPANAAAPARDMLALALVFMGLTFAVFLVYAAFAAAARRHVIARPNVMLWLRRSFAGAFAVLGLKLAFASR